jgi:hypothetical protein
MPSGSAGAGTGMFFFLWKANDLEPLKKEVTNEKENSLIRRSCSGLLLLCDRRDRSGFYRGLDRNLVVLG